jgi:hypothetical protein
MTEQRDPLRPASSRDLVESDLDSAPDPDLEVLSGSEFTRPLPHIGEGDPGAAPVATTAGALDRRRRLDTSSEWFWPCVTAVGVAFVILVNWLANAVPFNGQTTGEVITKDPTLFQPAGWAFTIWGLIYALLAVFVVYFVLPMGRRNPFAQRIAPWLAIANVANIAWLLVWHFEFFPLSMALILILLGSLAVIYTLLHWRRKGEREATNAERYALWPLASIYLGWITVASMANAVLLMDRRGWNGPFSLEWWSVIFLLVAIVASAFFGFLRRDAAYPLVIAWAAAAIAVEVWDRSTLVGIVAIITAVAAGVLAIVGFLMAFDRRAMMGMYSTKKGQDAPV